MDKLLPSSFCSTHGSQSHLFEVHLLLTASLRHIKSILPKDQCPELGLEGHRGSCLSVQPHLMWHCTTLWFQPLDHSMFHFTHPKGFAQALSSPQSILPAPFWLVNAYNFSNFSLVVTKVQYFLLNILVLTFTAVITVIFSSVLWFFD